MSASHTIRILLADDHTILRQGLKQIINDALPNVEFGEAGNAEETTSRLKERPWDVLILDINMPGRNGFEVLAEVCRHHPRLPVLVLSSTPEDQLGLRAIRAGAAGYLNKQTAPELLVQAVQTLRAGGQFISPDLAARLATEVRRRTERIGHEALSDRELQVFNLTASGRGVKEIAGELDLSRVGSQHKNNQHVPHAGIREARREKRCRARALRAGARLTGYAVTTRSDSRLPQPDETD
jgi:two-component system, NarL family, invasion response regulator UvrY